MTRYERKVSNIADDVNRYFGMYLCGLTRCLQCETVSYVLDEMCDVELELPSGGIVSVASKYSCFENSNLVVVATKLMLFGYQVQFHYFSFCYREVTAPA